MYDKPSDLAVLANIARGEFALPMNPNLFRSMFKVKDVDVLDTDESFEGDSKILNRSILDKYLRNCITFYDEKDESEFPTEIDHGIKFVDMGPVTFKDYKIFESKLISDIRKIQNDEDADLEAIGKKLNNFLAQTRQLCSSSSAAQIAVAMKQAKAAASATASAAESEPKKRRQRIKPDLSTINYDDCESTKLTAVVRETMDLMTKENMKPCIIHCHFIDTTQKHLVHLFNKEPYFAENPDKIRFINSHVKESEIKDIINTYNEGNIDVLVLSDVASEGVHFKGTRQLHIVEPPWNESSIQQIVGRAVRYRSHADLPEDQRNVHIFKWVTKLSDEQIRGFDVSGIGNEITKTADQRLYEMVEQKKISIDAFQDVLKCASIEKNVFHEPFECDDDSKGATGATALPKYTTVMRDPDHIFRDDGDMIEIIKASVTRNPSRGRPRRSTTIRRSTSLGSTELRNALRDFSWDFPDVMNVS
jgi:hypothetical protein